MKHRLAALVVLWLTVAAGFPARAIGLVLDHEVYLGGMSVLAIQTRLDLGPHAYAVRMDATLDGLPRLFSDWWAEVTAEGAVDGPGLEPRTHRVRRMHRGSIRTIDMRYRRDGTIAVAFDPPQERPDDPVLSDGAIDPLSGMVAMMVQVSTRGGCAGTLPAFDGKRRYDLVFTDRGPAQLAANRYAAYAGPVRRCNVRLVPVAGDWDWGEKGSEHTPVERTFELWLAAPVDGGPMVPVRLEGEIWLGRVIIHLAAIHDDPAVTAR